MKKQNKEKKKFIIGIFLLLILFLGLGYAILTEQLAINSSVEYGTMKWDVGFKSSEDGGGSIVSSSSISSDKKSITITCNVGTSASSETCIAKAVIENNSTFNVALNKAPTITFDNTYINSVSAVWTSNSAEVIANDFIGHGESKEMQITIITKELTKDMLPSSALSSPIKLTMDWIETETETELTYDWSNKTAVFVGDSITYGSNTTPYWKVMAEDLSLSGVLGMGVNSSTISAQSDYGSTKQPLIERYQNIPDADLITIFMGTNDYGHETPLGTINDTTDVSFYGALNVILPALKEEHPNSRIVYLTPIHRYGLGTSGILGTKFTYDYLDNGVGANLEDYVNAIKEVCAKYSIPVIDLYNLFELDPTLEEVRTQYMPDGLHPNVAGHQLLAKEIEENLKYIPPITYEKNNDTIKMRIGNKFSSSTASSTNRISAARNVYLEAGSVIKIDDSTNYSFGVFVEDSEIVQSSTTYRTWSIEDYTVTESGWYGIAIKRADDSDFDLGNTDPSYLGDYVSFTKATIRDISNYNNIIVNKGNDFTAGYEDDTLRSSLAENIYLKAGSTIKLVDSSKYLLGVFTQSGATVEQVSGTGTCLQSWATTDFTATTDGWYGIAFKKADGTEFDLGGTDPNTAENYIIIE